MILPSALGRHQIATIYVQYSNTGTVAMPAPMLTLSDPQGDRPLLTLNQSLITQGLWTSAIPSGFSTSISILASGATPGVLQPGESETVPVYYAGLQQPWNFNITTVPFTLGVIAATPPPQLAVFLLGLPISDPPIDWNSLKSTLQPSWINSNAWSQIYANVTAQAGGTASSYVKMLDKEAQYLGQQGENVTDIGQLWNFLILQANGLSPVSTLASSVDASVNTPGLSLNFSRSFGSTINSRNQMGAFGLGWSVPWQTSLSVQFDGTVIITADNGNQFLYQPDSRSPGRYFSSAGDSNTLTNGPGGTFNWTQANGTVTSFGSNGQLASVQDANGNKITAGYSRSGQLTTLTHSSGQSLTIAYNAAGLIASILDSDGRQTTYTYDAANLHLLSVQTPTGTTSYAYGIGNTLTSITSPSGTHQYYAYDSLGRLSDSSVDGNADLVTYSYDEPGEVTATDALGNPRRTFFDYRGLPVKTQDALGNITSVTYDPTTLMVNKLTDPTGQSQTFKYDSMGNVISSTNQLGNTAGYTYGADSRLTSLTDANGNLTKYAYDQSGNLLTTTYANGSTSTSTFDPLGNPLSFTNQNGQTIGYTYNVAGQVTQQSFPDGSTTTFTYDAHGNLKTAVDATGTITFTYNSADELTRVDYPNGMFLQFTLDAGGRRTQMVDQTGFTIQYTYNAAGQLSGLLDGNNAMIVSYTYDPVGRLSRKDNANGTFTTYAYDADGNVLHLINYEPGGTAINSRFDYAYNTLGQDTTMATLDGTWTYTYDGTGQLTHAVFASTNPSISSQNLIYNYDAMGNRMSTVINGITTIYATNTLNECTNVGGVTQTYDADGNLINDGNNTYSYDALNRLVSISTGAGTTTFTYDALGSRSSMVVGGSTTEYLTDPEDLNTVVGEFDLSNNTATHNVFGIGLVSRQTPSVVISYDFDALGSTADVTDPSGTVAAKYSYSPFGNTVTQGPAPSGAANPFTYGGAAGITNSGSNLYAYGDVYYDSFLTQFQGQLAPYSINSIENTGAGGANWAESAATFANSSSVVAGGISSGLNYVFGSDAVLVFSSHESSEIQIIGETGQISIEIDQFSLTVVDVGRITEFADKLGNGLAGLGLISDLFVVSSATDPNYFGLALDAAALTVGLTVGGPAAFGIGLIGLLQSQFRDILPVDVSSLIGKWLTSIASAFDPNSIVGPSGYGSPNFVAASQPLPYRINFENSEAATAPAQAVTITNQLPSTLNWSTFQLTGIGFGDTIVTIPPDTQHYQTTVAMTYNGNTFNVLVEVGIHTATGQVYATFQSIDPETELPPDVLTGFLPPENGTGRGQGYISFTVQPVAGLPTGTAIRDVALVTFDQNNAIATDQVSETDPTQGTDPKKEALVTLDAVAPTSSVNALPAQSKDGFTLTWSGQDDAGGSGVASYDIYASDNGGPYSMILQGTTLTSAVISGGTGGHQYRFYSVATDNVGNREAAHANADATTIDTTAPMIATPTSANTAGTTATLGGNVTSDGGSAITERGVIYSLLSVNPNPQIGGTGVTKATTSGTTGIFTVNVTNLNPNSDYCFVAYATNSVGTTYTSPVSTFATGPLTVTSVNQGTGPTLIHTGDILTSSVSAVSVHFSDNVNSVAGGTNSVTNPSNWLLFRYGIDVSDEISGITFTANPNTLQYVATASFSVPLFQGGYRLIVRQGIQDGIGRPLDGDGNGIPGGDFGINFYVAQTVNGVSDVAPWLYQIEQTPLSAAGPLATPVTSSLLAFDADSNNWTGATIQIEANYLSDQDVLGFVNTPYITGSWNAATGTLTLSGTDTVSDYRTALRNVTYHNTSATPNTSLTRTIDFQTTDGTLPSNVITRDVMVMASSIPAVISNVNGIGTFYEGDPAFAIAAGLTISDPNTVNLSSATVSFTNWQGEDRLEFNNIFALQHTFTQDLVAHTATFTITGQDLVDHYQTLLRSVIYWDVSANPVRTPRVASFTVTDGLSTSNAPTRNIVDVAVNQPPTLTAIETSPLAFKANDTTSFPPLPISNTLLVGDPDSNNLTKATVQISSGYENDANGNDVLSFANQLGITGSFNATTGTLTLTGTSSVSNYRTALGSVTFSTSGAAVSTASRTLTIVATDDYSANSLAATRTVSVTTTNSPPALTGISSTALSYVRGAAAVAVAPSLLIFDPDSINMAGATVQIAANYQSGQDVLAATTGFGITSSFNSTTGTLTLSGISSIANYQTVLQSLTYKTNSAGASTATRTISFTVNDGLANSSTVVRNVTVN